jgi:hypothetical protein
MGFILALICVGFKFGCQFKFGSKVGIGVNVIRKIGKEPLHLGPQLSALSPPGHLKLLSLVC